MSCFKTLTVGSDLSALDIFLSVDGVPINASGVEWAVLDAADTIATYGSGVNIDTGRYTASGVVPAGYQLGTWQIDWTILPVGGGIVNATEEFCVQALDISFGFAPPEDTTSAIYDAVRVDLGDPEGQFLFDSFLQRVLVKAVRRLNQTLGTAVVFRGPVGIPGGFGGRRINVIEITVDVDGGTISPSNREVEDLIILQMEYIIKTSELSTFKRLLATGPFSSGANVGTLEGTSVTNPDGTVVSVSSSRFQSRASLYRFDVENSKKELDAAVLRFLSRLTGNFGKLIY